MKKEEILEKSRRSNQDEGIQYAENQGLKIGYVAFAGLFTVLALLCLFFWQMNAFYAISALFWTHFSAEGFSKYHFTKQKKYFVSFVCALTAAILFTFIFILSLFRVLA